MPLDIDHLRTWINRQEILTDTATLVPVAALSATLDRDDPAPKPGDTLPPLWHWLYHLPLARQSQIGPDGHPKRGGFLPPVPLPRRMWAGGRLTFHRPIPLGQQITRTSTIVDVTEKSGRSGSLCFVLVRHDVAVPDGLALTEEHDIVYRDPPGPDDPTPQPKPAPTDATWSRTIVPDDVLLFRYSALTFNGHRIHYDRRYVTTEEGYPGLIVHGPLIATLLVDLYRCNNNDRPLKSFRFRALSPLFDIAPFSVHGRPGADGKVALWAANAQGGLAMEAEAVIA
ncbi:MAG: MaoC family dehydratase N-terminal domain-containing protein [Acetobacteraceae bacterium]